LALIGKKGYLKGGKYLGKGRKVSWNKALFGKLVLILKGRGVPKEPLPRGKKGLVSIPTAFLWNLYWGNLEGW